MLLADVEDVEKIDFAIRLILWTSGQFTHTANMGFDSGNAEAIQT